METESGFATEMDEMMVEDAGILSEVQEEITLGQEEVATESPFAIPPTPNTPNTPTPSMDTPTDQHPQTDMSPKLPERQPSEEILPPPVKTEPMKTEPAAGRKTPAKRIRRPAGTSSRRGRSAGSAPAEEEEEEEEETDGEEPSGEPFTSSEEVSAKPAKKARKTGPAKKATKTVAVKRSSGRSSRKKIDPDFCYDEPVGFAGPGRKQRASGSALVSASSRRKSDVAVVVGVVGQSPPSQQHEEGEGSKADEVPPSVGLAGTLDSYAFTGSPGVATVAPSQQLLPLPLPLPADGDDGDEARVTAGREVALADDVTQPSSEQDSVVQKRAGKAMRKNPKAASTTGEPGGKGPVRPTKLYCICKKPEEKRFMIECDKCQEWFHGSCVGITKKQGAKLVKERLPWLCPPCKLTMPGAAAGGEPATSFDSSDELPAALKIDEETSTMKGSDPDFELDVKKPAKLKKKKKLSASAAATSTATSATTSATTSTAKNLVSGPSRLTPSKKAGAGLRVPSPVKKTQSDALKESMADKAKEAAKSLSKHPKVEEKPPVESDSTGLVLTALGKPAAAGSRSLRHTHLSRPGRPAPLTTKADSLFESPKQSPRHTVTSPQSKTETGGKQPGKQGSAQKAKPSQCIVCKKHHGRENSLYCSSECIMRHGMDALELVKSTPNTPSDRIAVVEKQTGVVLMGGDAPVRTALLAWLEGHQTFCVSIPSGLLRERAERAGGAVQLDTVRASTRMMLKDHLMNRWKDAADLHALYPSESLPTLAADIEIGLFSKFKEANQEYKKKYRAIVLNINDKKNENFFRRLIKREIPSDEVAHLTQEQMASDSLTQWRQQVERKELDLIIQTQMEEQLDQRPVIKKTHRGDEFFGDEIAEENETRPEQQPNIEMSVLTDPTAAESDTPPPNSHTNFSPAVLTSPSDVTMKSPAYSFNSTPKVSQTPSQTSAQSPREAGLQRTSYSSPSGSGGGGGSGGSGFKMPLVGGSPSSSDRKRKLVKVEEDASSPVSSTSEYSPDSADEQPEGVIWQGEVDTKDLPAARLQAFSVYGKGAEFMTELPLRLEQLGRIQLTQLWPYLEQVKPLKDIAVVILKAPPGRVSNEFNSLHYFLTTRGRVSVLGPLPSTFKDFYLIALKENEPLPESLTFSEGVEFEVVHGKILLGIIIHHRTVRHVAPMGRGLFEVPSVTSREKKLSPYPSPKTPDTADTSPISHTGIRFSARTHDPIVSRFLAMEGGPSTITPFTVNPPVAVEQSLEVLDTSEPMDLDDDMVKKESSTDLQPVSVPDLLKLVKALPGKTQAALGLAPSVKAKVAPPVDPRLSRLNQQQSAVVAEGESSGRTHPIQINLAMNAAPSQVAPPTVKERVLLPPSTSTAPPAAAQLDTSTEPDIDSSFGFSQKFIENLAKIEFPEGLKEALRSIVPSTSQPTAPPPAPETAGRRPPLLGLAPPEYLVPPPYYPPSTGRPDYTVPPPVRTPYQPPDYHHEPHASFGERLPPRSGGGGGGSGGGGGGGGGTYSASADHPQQQQRWSAPSPDHPPRGQYGNRSDSQEWNRGGDGRTYHHEDFRDQGLPPSSRASRPPVASRWGDRSVQAASDRDAVAPPSLRRQVHSPPRLPPRVRTRSRDFDRNRRDSPPPLRRERFNDRRGSDDRPRRGDGDRLPPARRRSRSRSPPGGGGGGGWNGRRDDNRNRRRDSRERIGGRARVEVGVGEKVGVDEFGRDVSLRRQLSGSRDRDSVDKSGATGGKTTGSGGGSQHSSDTPSQMESGSEGRRRSEGEERRTENGEGVPSLATGNGESADAPTEAQ